MTTIKLTKQQAKDLVDILKWQVRNCWDVLSMETDEECRAAIKREMRLSKELLEQLGVDWGSVKRFVKQERPKDGATSRVLDNLVRA